MKSRFRLDIGWIRRLPGEVRWLVDDVEWAAMGAKLHGAARRKKSRAAWRRAMRAFERLRRMCLGSKPRRVDVRRLAAKVEGLFNSATDRTRPSAEPPPSARKITVLDDYYASGDYESFVFDRCRDPRTHYDRWRGRYGHRLQEQHDPQADERAQACMVYPEALLPPRTNHRRGRWRIIVEFWPRPSAKERARGKATVVKVSPRIEIDGGLAHQLRMIEKRALRGLRRNQRKAAGRRTQANPPAARRSRTTGGDQRG